MGAGLQIVRSRDESAHRREDTDGREVRSRHDLGANGLMLLSAREVHTGGSATEDAIEDGSAPAARGRVDTTSTDQRRYDVARSRPTQFMSTNCPGSLTPRSERTRT